MHHYHSPIQTLISNHIFDRQNQKKGGIKCLIRESIESESESECTTADHSYPPSVPTLRPVFHLSAVNSKSPYQSTSYSNTSLTPINDGMSLFLDGSTGTEVASAIGHTRWSHTSPQDRLNELSNLVLDPSQIHGPVNEWVSALEARWVKVDSRDDGAIREWCRAASGQAATGNKLLYLLSTVTEDLGDWTLDTEDIKNIFNQSYTITQALCRAVTCIELRAESRSV